MKVAHVAVWHYPRHRTCGPVIYLHNLARAQRLAGDDAYVVCGAETVPGVSPYSTAAQVHDGVEYLKIFNRPAPEHDHWHPEREAHDPDLQETLTRVFAERPPDVVHIHNFAGLSFDIVAAAQSSGAKVVASLHNYFPLCSRDDLFFANAVNCEGPQHQSCSRCLGTMLGDASYRARHSAGVEMLNACDALLPVSTRVAEIYCAHGVAGHLMQVERIGSETASRLWTAIGQGRVAAARRQLDDNLSVQASAAPEPPLRIVTFGAGLARKGALVVLQAARRLAHPERFEISVYGALTRDVRESFVEICEPALLERIKFFDAFDQRDLPQILGDSDVAALAPRWEDNGPQTVFESLAAGLPVIATRVGGIPDVVNDGVNGILAEEGDIDALADAFELLASDRTRLNALRAAIEPPRLIPEHERRLREIYAQIAPQAADSAAPARSRLVEDASRSHPGEMPESWTVLWPYDFNELGTALSLAAVYKNRIRIMRIGILGADVREAGVVIIQTLQALGIPQEALPDIVLDQLTEPRGPSIVEFCDAITSLPEPGASPTPLALAS